MLGVTWRFLDDGMIYTAVVQGSIMNVVICYWCNWFICPIIVGMALFSCFQPITDLSSGGLSSAPLENNIAEYWQILVVTVYILSAHISFRRRCKCAQKNKPCSWLTDGTEEAGERRWKTLDVCLNVTTNTCSDCSEADACLLWMAHSWATDKSLHSCWDQLHAARNGEGLPGPRLRTHGVFDGGPAGCITLSLHLLTCLPQQFVPFRPIIHRTKSASTADPAFVWFKQVVGHKQPLNWFIPPHFIWL